MTDVTSLLGPLQASSRVSGRPVTTAEDLRARVPDQLGDALVFETAGSTGEPKRIPYGAHEIMDFARSTATALRIAGLTEDDGVMNLFAPTPHISGWGYSVGAQQTGATVYNTDFTDFETILEQGNEAAITVVAATPSVGRSVGERITSEYGPPHKLFPNVRLVTSAAEPVTETLRSDIKQLWGADAVHDMYAAVETGIIAAASDGSRRMIPLLDRFVLEVLSDAEERPDPVDIREFETETAGSLLVSDPDREKLPLFRYRVGDKVRVHPAGDVPRIEVLGREDNAINLGGALLYEMQLEQALRDTYGADMQAWKAFVSKDKRDQPTVRVYVVDGDLEEHDEEFRENLFRRNAPVEEAYELDIVGSLELVCVASLSDVEAAEGVTFDEDVTDDRIVFE